MFFTDTFFGLRLIIDTVLYFLRTRILYLREKLKISILDLPRIIKEEASILALQDGEDSGKEVLKTDSSLNAVIMGHTHIPKEVRYPNGQIYINTGTWIKMVNLDLRYFGRSIRRPFCLIAYPKKDMANRAQGDTPLVLLLEWKGHSGDYNYFIH